MDLQASLAHPRAAMCSHPDSVAILQQLLWLIGVKVDVEVDTVHGIAGQPGTPTCRNVLPSRLGRYLAAAAEADRSKGCCRGRRLYWYDPFANRPSCQQTLVALVL